MADKPYRVAIMARVSTLKQGDKPMSLPEQYRECREYALNRGWIVVAELEDKASGMKWDRPGLNAAIELAEHGSIDGVLALNHDRLCRDDDVRSWLKIELKRHNARIHYTSVPDQIETAEDRAMDGMHSIMARYMRDKIAVGTTKGRATRVKDGKILHNGTPAFGYKLNDDKTGYDVNPVTAPWVVAIFKKYVQGSSPRQIAEWLNTEPGAPPALRGEKWPRDTVAQILAREDYTGIGYRLGYEIPTDEHGRPLTKHPVQYKDQAVKMAFPEIVKPELWQQAEAMRREATHRSNITKAKADPEAALLQGMGRVICGGCGGTMPFESRKHRGEGKGLYRCRRTACTRRASFSQPAIDESVLWVIETMVMNDRWFKDRYNASLEAGGSLDQEIDQATEAVKELAKNRKELQKRVTDAAGNDLLYEPLSEQLQTVQAQWLAAKEREADLLRQRAQGQRNVEQLRDFEKWLASHREGFAQLDNAGRKRLVALINFRVVVRRDKAFGAVVSITSAPLDGWEGPGTTEALKRVTFGTSR